MRRSSFPSSRRLFLTPLLLTIGLLTLIMATAGLAPAPSEARIPAAAPSANDTLYATADTYVNAASPTTNYGSATVLSLGRTASGLDQRILIRFDLSSIPTGSTINSATLQLYTEINLAAAAAPDTAGQVWPQPHRRRRARRLDRDSRHMEYETDHLGGRRCADDR